MTRMPPRERLLDLGTLVLFGLIFGALCVTSYTQKSATFDEPVHLFAGYAALAEGDHRVDPTHPPAGRLWAALPLLWTDEPAISLEQIDAMRGRDWLFRTTTASRDFMYVDNDGDRLLYAARFMVVLLGVVLGALIYRWTHETLGVVPARWVLIFYALTPTLLAHASLVTTDVAVTLSIVATLYCLWRVVERPTPGWMVATGLASGLAITTKFSGVMVLPMLAVLIIVSVRNRHSPMTWRSAAALAGVTGVMTLAVVWAMYGFRYTPSASTEWVFHVDRLPHVQDHFGQWLGVFQWVDTHHLLPNAFTHGLLYSQAAVAQLPAYLAGQYSDTGWWYYFPLAFLIKTPVVLLTLFIAGLGVLAVRRQDGAPLIAWFLIVPIVIILGVAMWSGINIGVRHILPMYPLVAMVAGVAAAALWKTRRRAVRICLPVLTTAWAVQVSVIHPDYLTYFNRLIGGPANGHEYLTDSNLDWGQDLKPLKAWMDETGVTHINLAYFGISDPAYYGINWTPLPGSGISATSASRPQLPGYVAISATVQSGVYLPRRWRLFYRAFRDQEPVAVIGNSIRVYRVDRWPEPPHRPWTDARLAATRGLADSLIEWGWHSHAARHLEDYLEQRPDDIGALAKLTTAYVALDRVDAALRAVDRTRDRLPDHPAVHDLRGRVLAAQGRLSDAMRSFERSVALDPAWQAPRDALRAIERAGGGGGTELGAT
jgi:hypothetical protein